MKKCAPEEKRDVRQRNLRRGAFPRSTAGSLLAIIIKAMKSNSQQTDEIKQPAISQLSHSRTRARYRLFPRRSTLLGGVWIRPLARCSSQFEPDDSEPFEPFPALDLLHGPIHRLFKSLYRHSQELLFTWGRQFIEQYHKKASTLVLLVVTG